MEKSEKPKSTLFQLIVKIWTVHVMAVVIYLFVIAVFARIVGNQASIIIASAVTTVMYLVMTYLEGWRQGNKDKNTVQYGRTSYDKHRALKAALLSQTPGLLLGLLCIFGVNAAFVTAGVRLFFISMAYEIQLLKAGFPPIYLLPALLPFLSVVPGYALGYRDRRIINRLLYTKKSE